MDTKDFPALQNILDDLSTMTGAAKGYIEDIKTTVMYDMYLVNFLDAAGIEYRGESYKYRLPMSLLVVKVTIEGEPFICFVSGRTKTVCHKIFVRRLFEDSIEWRPDQFG